jgi:hypothetical protein
MKRKRQYQREMAKSNEAEIEMKWRRLMANRNGENQWRISEMKKNIESEMASKA